MIPGDFVKLSILKRHGQVTEVLESPRSYLVKIKKRINRYHLILMPYLKNLPDTSVLLYFPDNDLRSPLSEESNENERTTKLLYDGKEHNPHYPNLPQLDPLRLYGTLLREPNRFQF